MHKIFQPEKHLLNYDEIDTLHKEFLDIYNSMDLANNESIKKVATKLHEHTKHHFAHEEKLMDRYDYPRSREHKDEHAKVLAELQFFIDKSHSVFGMNILKSYMSEKLPYWFDLHLISMDSDLTAYLKNFYNKKKELEIN